MFEKLSWVCVKKKKFFRDVKHLIVNIIIFFSGKLVLETEIRDFLRRLYQFASKCLLVRELRFFKYKLYNRVTTPLPDYLKFNSSDAWNQKVTASIFLYESIILYSVFCISLFVWFSKLSCWKWHSNVYDKGFKLQVENPTFGKFSDGEYSISSPHVFRRSWADNKRIE